MGYFEQILEQSAKLGGAVDEALEPARTYLRRADQLNEALRTARAAEEATYGKLVSAVADGKIPPSQVPAKATQVWVYDSASSKVIAQAVATCHGSAASAARSAGPAIFTALQRRVAGIVAESVQQSVELPRGVDSEAKALRARNGDRRALDVWERLRALVDDWTACHELARTMQLATWVPGPSHPRDRDGARIFERYEKPLALPAGYWTLTPAELRLGVAKAHGAGPGLYEWPDAVARWERIDRRQRPYLHMETVQTHDSRGNLLHESKSPPVASEFAPSAPTG